MEGELSGLKAVLEGLEREGVEEMETEKVMEV